MLFSAGWDSTVNVLTQSQSVPASAALGHPTAAAADTQDSCYSSCSEESHSSLSREPSETLAAESTPQSAPDNVSPHLLDFATKLGYSETQLRFVLDKVGGGGPVGQDRVLAELIKLGKDVCRQSSAPLDSFSSSSTPPSRQLRSVVIDGSNLAMTHGRKEVFSCVGIRDCVDFFRERGHADVKVFVPQFRRETARADCPITDQHILLELESEGVLVWTPSRRVGGRRIVCHDDRYILKTAADKDAVIVSNDEYRDLVKETPHYRRLVEERLLMYSFVDGRFMPPDDPLGRHGPKLDQFLSKGGAAPSAQLCPSLMYEGQHHPQQHAQSLQDRQHAAVCRSQSLNVPMTISVDPFQSSRMMRQPSPLSYQHMQQHAPIGKKLSTPEQRSSGPPPDPFPVQRPSPLLAVPNVWQHQSLNRNLSAPSHAQHHSFGQTTQGLDWIALDQQQKNSVSDTQLNWAAALPDNDLWRGESNDSALGSEGHFFVPSTAVWGQSEYSVGPVSPLCASTVESAEDTRLKLQYNLSQLFPQATVAAVMSAHPDESDPQKLCAMMLGLQASMANAP
uniref:RNase NYN domain-containing protein n=1 Tax=Plectus sambesii TaxID=2011161 RepID=A0A914VLH6_9BILA